MAVAPPQTTERLASYNPATGELLGTVPIHSAADVDTVVGRARVAAERWAALSFDARTKELTAFRKALAANVDELAELMHRENGKPLLEAYQELILAIGHVQHAMTRAEPAMAPRRVSAGLMANYKATINYRPLGVVGVSGPWNYPMFTPLGSIAYALAAGNTVVFKPSELMPLLGVKLGE
ncbi:MAG: aldehyde dehydrogenase family protein, partial [Kofleriaceae bacterium]